MTTSLNDELRTRAPHLDATWADAFIIELRLRGASGAAIGAALLEVEFHMAEHGGQVAEVFGKPATYAASLKLPDTQQWTTSEVTRMCVKGSLGVLGIWLLLTGVDPLRIGGAASLQHVAMGTVVLANIALAVALTTWGTAILRLLLDHSLVGIALMVAVFATVVVLAVLVPGPVVLVPPPVALGGGLIAIAALAAIVVSERRRGTAPEDPISFPHH